MDKIGPEQLHVRELLARLASGEVQEVILAMNPDVEGETTATYLSRIIRPLGVRATRLASGLPVGGDLEYATRSRWVVPSRRGASSSRMNEGSHHGNQQKR